MIEKIYIPTVRRFDNQITFSNLPEELQKRVVMVVEPKERPFYNYDCEYLAIPDEFVGKWNQLSLTRKFIYETAGNIKYAMLDDDLIFGRRNAKYWTGISNMELTKRNNSPEDILYMFEKLSTFLDEGNIGITGLSDGIAPPADKEYLDTVGVFSAFFIDGKKLYPHLNDMDLTSTRVCEDIIFLFECLSRGINTRLSIEFTYNNKSQQSAKLKDTRIIWTESGANTNEDFFQSTMHYETLEKIKQRFPDGLTIKTVDGKKKNIKHWKKVYCSKVNNNENSLGDII